MIQIAPGWELNSDRNGDWLFVQVVGRNASAADTPPLAEQIWGLLERASLRRVIVELSQVEILYSYLIGQLILLHKRVGSQGGLVRLCGLSTHNREALHLCRLDQHLPCFASREEAQRGGK